ncbi:MAG: Lrp/AsnC ligand binding domain-containing protein [Candidatus Bathyarchaeota archaeon]|nr:Lrp/AsnC ligand binding domain-containing protein [Candidatus Bathyarchaeota archaeon]
MASAYLLLNVETGTDEEVIDSLKPIREVKEAWMVYGVYDIVVRVEAETMEELKNVVSWTIRRLDRVRSTMTMIIV